MNKLCLVYKKRTIIRIFYFFENMNTDFLAIFKVVIAWFIDQPTHSIINKLNLCHSTIRKIILKIGGVDFSNDKLRDINKKVRIDETMFNFKCKSYHGRSPSIQTDALYIIAFDGKITRAFANVIPNMEAATMLSIISSQVLHNSKIHTDKHQSYQKLTILGFNHDTVYHKFYFIDKISGANTQGIESFNNG